jgi:hypothetical protein
MLDYEGQNFVALTVDILQPVDSAKTKARLYPFVVLCDPSGTCFNAYKIAGAIPTNYVIDANDTVRYRLEGFNEAAVRAAIEGYLTGVAETPAAQPIEFTAVGANPVVGHSAVRFNLPKAANVTLRVYSTSGALVRTLVNGQMAAGANTVNWNLQDNAGKQVGNGLYLYELNAGSQVAQAKVSVLK